MRVAVVGAGIVGVSTAFELAAQGHEVSVFEQRGSVAAETSFAPGGISSAALSGVWGGLCGIAPLRLETRGLGALSWRLAARKTQRQADKTAQGARALRELCLLGQSRLATLRHQLKLDYERSEGMLVLLRGEREWKAAQAFSEQLQAASIPHALLDAAGCLAREPGLHTDTPLQGGLHLPGDEAANGRELCVLLRTAAQRLGARFQFHARVSQIQGGSRPTLVHDYAVPEVGASNGAQEARSREGPSTLPLPRGAQKEDFDAIVLCTGHTPPPAWQARNKPWPLLQLWASSLTAPLRQMEAFPDLGPRGALVDQQHQISISRIGQRVRVSGGASLRAGGTAATQQLMHTVLNDWFPGAAQPGQFQLWQGTRGMLPDGLPVIGRSAEAGIWLNLAHGGLGGMLAQGAAVSLSALLSATQSAVNIDPLSPERLS